MSESPGRSELPDLPEEMEQELAALADGSLEPQRRERLSERVERSPELQHALAEQRRALALTAAAQHEAPAELHRRVEAMIEESATVLGNGASAGGSDRARGSSRGHLLRRRWRWRPRYTGLAAATTALIAVVLAVALTTGKSATITVQQAAALTLSPATLPAPAESSAHHSQLDASVGGVAFPYWNERFGWHGSGARLDHVGGRAVRTVFYTSSSGARVGYAIVSGPAPSASSGSLVKRWGVSYRVWAHDGATVISWQRDGHLCVLSGHDVTTRTLLALASWGSARARSS